MNEVSDHALQEAATELGMVLREQARRIATAESCTGGWVAKMLTDTAGSSDYFEAGLVTYSNAAKEKLIGVTPLSLEKHGAVSEAVVRRWYPEPSPSPAPMWPWQSVVWQVPAG